ncbi:hypothetical protein ACE1TI_19890 [Alteribacillus sp. JSM 102045]|uniref:hypothetical protein n=1 Tax=Alteribacillus sp. JSM 102045 TaxID=1562101 RepID=UPI0035C095DE
MENVKAMNLYRIVILEFLPYYFTGFWDENAIEERGFVIGSAIDMEDNSPNEVPLMTLTNQFVIPTGVGAPTQQSRSLLVNSPFFDQWHTYWYHWLTN